MNLASTVDGAPEVLTSREAEASCGLILRTVIRRVERGGLQYHLARALARGAAEAVAKAFEDGRPFLAVRRYFEAWPVGRRTEP